MQTPLYTYLLEFVSVALACSLLLTEVDGPSAGLVSIICLSKIWIRRLDTEALTVHPPMTWLWYTGGIAAAHVGRPCSRYPAAYVLVAALEHNPRNGKNAGSCRMTRMKSYDGRRNICRLQRHTVTVSTGGQSRVTSGNLCVHMDSCYSSLSWRTTRSLACPVSQRTLTVISLEPSFSFPDSEHGGL
jgi:hypothetical protein